MLKSRYILNLYFFKKNNAAQHCGFEHARPKLTVGRRKTTPEHNYLCVTCDFFSIFLLDTLHVPLYFPLVPLFWISGNVFSGFQSQSGFCLIYIVEVNVTYIPWDPPLVLHIADLLTDSIAGRQQGSYMTKDITGTSEARTPNHKITMWPVTLSHLRPELWFMFCYKFYNYQFSFLHLSVPAKLLNDITDTIALLNP